jgi:hypothetical protein
MTTAAFLLALALAAPPKAANPACAPPAQVRVDSPSAYAIAVVDGLGWIRRGTNRMPDDGPREVSEVVAILGRTQGDFACAGRYVAPFRKSVSDRIRPSAEALAARCGRLQETTGAMATALQSQADDRLEEAVRQKNQAWGEFLVAAAEAIGVVVESRDESQGRLLVTKAERQALKSRLEKEFGKSVRAGGKDEQDPLTMVAAGWYEVLDNPRYRSLDDP